MSTPRILFCGVVLFLVTWLTLCVLAFKDDMERDRKQTKPTSCECQRLENK